MDIQSLLTFSAITMTYLDSVSYLTAAWIFLVIVTFLVFIFLLVSAMFRYTNEKHTSLKQTPTDGTGR